MKVISLYVLLCMFGFNIQAQSKSRILWNKFDNEPVQYASITSTGSFTISNEEGVFEYMETSDKILIQNVAYESLEILSDFLKGNDTIFMKPKVYELDEVIIDKDGRFNDMLKTILTEYAMEPHQEKFFLRAIIKKNDVLYKIVDFSGLLEKKALFDTKTKPIPKNNYSVQIDNIRKAGFENREYDFELFSFETLLTKIASLYLSPKIYNLSYRNTADNNFLKIIATPKNVNDTFTEGYYLVDNSNSTFNEIYILYENANADFDKIRDIKYRTPYFELKSNFQRNVKNNKLQLKQAIINSKTEVYSEGGIDIFDVSYILYANPVENPVKLKNNINLSKDMFELKAKYDSEYWAKNDILTLTNEMQDFINKVNTSENKSDFRTKTNMD